MPNAFQSQATMLPQVFQTSTPQDLSWNMDTGASSYLADIIGFSVKDYQTRRILLRCDSMADLYPITQQSSSQTPVVLLSFSSTTWHRRLGHPGDNVLRRLESKNLISCRKSKLSALCHACQLANVNVVRSMWLFKHKFNADGSLRRYKARLIANGRSQQQGIDCDDTFCLLDVKNVFLYGHLSETVYMHQSLGFVDPNKPDYVCHLQRSLYGLKQASRAWFQRFASYATRVGFQHSKTDSSLFFFHRGSDIAYLLLYVDDIILTLSSSAFLQRIIASLHNEFAMKDLGSLNYFLGISAQRSASGLFLSQSKFIEEILERAHMQNCNLCRTPVDTESKLGSDGDPVSDPTLYRSLVGAFSILPLRAQTYLMLSSSAKAEYRGVANVVAETAWIYNLLCELHIPLFTATLVYCDNVSAIYMFVNAVQHQCTKHIEIDIHFVRDFVASGQVRVLHVPSRFQYADIFTNGLPTTLFI
nr:ribonuclease H-like domain-containing protein [Tanacetum cinerariifolium]